MPVIATGNLPSVQVQVVKFGPGGGPARGRGFFTSSTGPGGEGSSIYRARVCPIIQVIQLEQLEVASASLSACTAAICPTVRDSDSRTRTQSVGPSQVTVTPL